MRCGMVCMLALFAVEASSADPWTRVSSPTIEIFTDGGEKTARDVLHRFETLQRVFDQSPIGIAPTPLRVFVFSSADEYRKFRVDPAATAFYLTGDDRDLIVLHTGVALERSASHEYLHMVMRHASPALPRWMDEGVAEFYSTISISKTKIYIGDI